MSSVKKLHVSRNPNHCLLQRNEASQKHVYKIKFLGIAFTSDGRQDEALNIRIGKPIAIMRTLQYSVVVRRELLKKSKALNFRNSLCPFSPAVSLYGHENLVITKKFRTHVHVSKMKFFRKIDGVTLLTKCASFEIRKSLKPLLLQIERSQLKRFGHGSRMP